MNDAEFLAWLRSGARRVVLIEARPFDGQAEHPIYLSQGGYTSGPADIPPNQPYADLATVPRFKGELGDSLDGVAVPAWGDIEVLNALGEFDHWLGWSWDKRPVALYVGAPDWPRAAFRPVLVGVLTDIAVKDGATLTLKIADRQQLFNTPVSTRSLADPEPLGGLVWQILGGEPVTSIDAVDDDGRLVSFAAEPALGRFSLAAPPVGRLNVRFTGGNASGGTLLPIPLGAVFNVTPPLLNGGLHRYLLADGPVQAVTACRDDGAPLPFTLDAANGRLTLNSAPTGTFTLDLQGRTDNGPWPHTVASLSRFLLQRYAGLTDAELDLASFARLDTDCPQTVGIWLADRTNLLDVLDSLLRSVGAWLWPDRNGRVRVGRLMAPTQASLQLGPDDLDARRELRLLRRRLPARSVSLRYRHNYQPLTNVREATPDADKAALRQAWQRLPLRQSTPYQGAEDLEPETCLMNIHDARTEAARRLLARRGVQSVWELPTLLAPLTMQIGDAVQFGAVRYLAGRFGVVVGIDEALTDNQTTLQVWVPHE
ncbi:hypothetical protein [Parachitinimonas caeni]|uniref:Phage tail protein n=1 Tax=Parachitinimonas caeni TaxID=3031301 RepID=A0ABT7DWR2_9NEIS|nr:hypothetical protein [Parachitinimonas caeni]MDK2124498.1 hypothetical protein [Parachitinimonas caeni]